MPTVLTTFCLCSEGPRRVCVHLLRHTEYIPTAAAFSICLRIAVDACAQEIAGVAKNLARLLCMAGTRASSPALSEVHDVTGECAGLVAEDVLHPTEVLVELARPHLPKTAKKTSAVQPFFGYAEERPVCNTKNAYIHTEYNRSVRVRTRGTGYCRPQSRRPQGTRTGRSKP